MNIRKLNINEISKELFSSFVRRQEVGDCWRKEDGAWVIKHEPFIDDWSEEDYTFLVSCLRNTIATGGVVYGAFLDGKLKGFCSVEAAPLGSKGQYRDLTSIHVSRELRGHGTGKTLFLAAADWARAHGAEKLYISAHSAVETQAFYRGLGCVEAKEYQSVHTEKEPFDCQMEYQL